MRDGEVLVSDEQFDVYVGELAGIEGVEVGGRLSVLPAVRATLASEDVLSMVRALEIVEYVEPG